MFKNKIDFKRQNKRDRKQIFKTIIYIFTRFIDILHIIGFNVGLLHKLYEQIHKIMLDDVMTLSIFHILSKNFHKKLSYTSIKKRNGKEIQNLGHKQRKSVPKGMYFKDLFTPIETDYCLPLYNWI